MTVLHKIMLFGRVASFRKACRGSSLEEPVEHQLFVLVIYMCAVDASVYGQQFDILRCNALAGA